MLRKAVAIAGLIVIVAASLLIVGSQGPGTRAATHPFGALMANPLAAHSEGFRQSYTHTVSNKSIRNRVPSVFSVEPLEHIL